MQGKGGSGPGPEGEDEDDDDESGDEADLSKYDLWGSDAEQGNSSKTGLCNTYHHDSETHVIECFILDNRYYIEPSRHDWLYLPIYKCTSVGI